MDSAFIKRLFLILDNEGWITHTAITKEELDRFSGNADEKIDEEKTNPKHELFKYPNLADEIARLMIDQMNQFIRENKFVASEQALRDFIVERTYVSYDHRDKQLEIGEEEDRPVYLSFRMCNAIRSISTRINQIFPNLSDSKSLLKSAIGFVFLSKTGTRSMATPNEKPPSPTRCHCTCRYPEVPDLQAHGAR